MFFILVFISIMSVTKIRIDDIDFTLIYIFFLEILFSTLIFVQKFRPVNHQLEIACR